MTNINNYNDLNIQLTPEEASAYTYLSTNESQWADKFKSAISLSRDKITQRLVASMYRENLANCYNNSCIREVTDIPFTLKTSRSHVLHLYFSNSNKVIIAPIVGMYAFNRVDVEGPFYFLEEDKLTRITHPELILNCILTELPKLDTDATLQFKMDLENSIANLALALSYQLYSFSQVTAPLWTLIENSKDSYLRSEQSVIEGHPLHPGAKLRKGLTASEAIQYSAEFDKPISLHFALLHKSVAKSQSLMSDYNEALFQRFPNLRQCVVAEVGHSQLPNYYVLVIHPWQFETIFKSQYDDLIQSSLYIPLNYQLDYYAGLSFRTLMPKVDTTPHIKLATNVHITGEIRTLSEQTTFNGPLVSKILKDIISQDNLFKNIQASTVDEIAGLHYYNSSEQQQTKRSEQIATLFRENIYQLIENDSIPIVPSSLVSCHVYNSETPLETLITRYYDNYAFDSIETAAIAWLTHYSKTLCDLVIPLVAKYGIALEAHLQNAIISIDNTGALHHIYIRDFEGLRIDTQQLNAMGYSTKDFHQKSLILTSNAQTVLNKAFYSTVQNHIGELILTAVKIWDAPHIENIIWSNVRTLIEQKLDEVAQSMDNSNRINNFKEILFAPTIDYKCVTTMRLVDEADYYTYVKVNNPLHK